MAGGFYSGAARSALPRCGRINRPPSWYIIPMLLDYLNTALERATYDKIEDEEPYYGEIPDIQGVWATGATLEECRRNLLQALEDWVFFSIYRGETVPVIGGVSLELPRAVG